MNHGRVNRKIWNKPIRLFFIYSFFMLALIIWFGYLSLSPKILGKDMSAFAQTRNTVRKTLKASRGTIYDFEGNALARNVSSYTVIAYLDGKKTDNYVEDTKKTAEALAPVLDVKANYLEDLLNKGKEKNKYQIELGKAGKGITELKKEEIEALDLKGIDFIESSKRFYPNGNFASYVIGYAKEKEVSTYVEETESEETSIEITGELGVEDQYNDLLKGKDGYLEYQQDRFGYKIQGTKEYNEPATNGYDIYLTLDSSIQRFIESEVEKVKKKYKPEWMQIAVMDAKTGAILGSGSTPSFDPNLRNITNYESPLVTYTYEPGSTMKIYTYLCAMDNGKYNGSEKFKSGQIKIGDDTIKDWNKYGWGNITFDKGFEYSSNVGITNLIQRYLNREQLKSCFSKYGFGKKTGIEIAREQTGELNFKYAVEVANAGFGQGLTTTAIQQLQAASLLANNGKMVKPYIISKIINPNTNDTYYEATTKLSKQIVQTESVDKVKELMHNVVFGTDPGTTGKSYKIDGIDLIAKTGTAQIYNSNGGGYLLGDNNYIFSFVGMYPKDDPAVIIYTAMKRPKKDTNKGLIQATKNVIMSIAKYRNFYEESSKEQEKKSVVLSSYINQNTKEVVNKLKKQDIDVITLGSGDRIVKQYPAQDIKVLAHDKVFLLTNQNDYKMPSLIGYSRSEVLALASLLNVKVEIEGNGLVVEQSIEKDDLLSNKATIKVKLAS